MFPPIIDEQKKLDANEQSAFQICEQYSETDSNNPKWYKCTKRSEATLLPKNYIPLYVEHLKFLIVKCSWKVTKIHRQFKIEQERFRKDFILMNKKPCQIAKIK